MRRLRHRHAAKALTPAPRRVTTGRATAVLLGGWLALGLACLGSGEDEGILSLEIALAPSGAAGAQMPAEGIRELDYPTGAHLRLERLALVVQGVELFGCPQEAEGPSAPTRRPGRWSLTEWLLPSAHAHAAEGPTRWGIPTVVDLTRPDGEARPIGTLRPPPGDYCRALVVLGPADADTPGLDAAADDLVGATLRASGAWSTQGASTAEPFELTGAAVVAVDVRFSPRRVGPGPDGSPLLSLRLAYDEALEGIPLDAPQAPAALVRRLADALRVE